MSPKVSILIPTYNREHILKSTIECALAQDYDNFEIIISDNKSTNNSWAIMQEYASKHPQVKVFQNAENLGAVRNWIECAKHATGEYVKILWSDDLIAKNFLSVCIPKFNDKVGFVYTATELFEDQTGTNDIYYRIGETGEYDSSVFIEGKLSGLDFPSSPGCAVFRRQDLLDHLLFDVPVSKGVNITAKAVGNDLLIFLLTAQKYPKIVFVNEILSFFRVHKNSITISSKKGELVFMYQLAESFFAEKYGLSAKGFKNFHGKLWLSLLLFKGTFGISKVSDFYKNKSVGFFDISYFHAIKLVLILFRRKVFKVR